MTDKPSHDEILRLLVTDGESTTQSGQSLSTLELARDSFPELRGGSWV